MSPATFLMALLASAPPLSVAVESATDCPSGADVTTRLQGLLPRLEPWDRIDRAQLRDEGAALRLTLVDGRSGAVMGERLLPASASCAALADAVALVIASWKSDVHAEFGADLPAVPRAKAPAPAASLASVAHSRTETTGLGPRAPDWELLLGAGVASAGPGAAPGGAAAAGFWGSPAALFALRGIYTPPRRSTGFALAGSFETNRAFDLGGGQARWNRSAAAVGIERRRLTRWARLAVRADLSLARLALSGRGFSENFQQIGWSPGVTAALRLALANATPGLRGSAWCELGAGFWSRWQEARIDPGGPAARLPRLTLMTTFGISLGRVR
jgi:hypothetical protein